MASRFCPVKDALCDECFTGLGDQPGLAFGAYPFTPYYLDFMSSLAKDLESQGVDLYLPHAHFEPSIVFCKLVPHIYESQFTLSEITEINQNVLFEHGYALGLGRPSIFLRHKDSKSQLPPFLADVERFEYHHRTDIAGKVASFIAEASIREEGQLFARGPALPAWFTEDVPTEPGLLYFIEAGVQQDVIRGLRRVLDQRPFTIQSDSALAKGHYLVNYVRMLRRSQFVVGHFISSRWQMCDETNAAVAFLLGIAAGLGRPMLILQQQPAPRPMIDLQGLIRPYSTETEAKEIANQWLEQIKEQVARARNAIVVPQKLEPDRLSEVSFGERAAERDPFLIDTFLKTAHYQRASRLECSLFLGPRGSGKTADFLFLSHELNQSPNNLTVIIRPYDSEFLKLQGFLSREFATTHYQFVHGSIWQTLIYTEVLNSLFEQFGQGAVGSSPEEQKAFDFRSSHREVFEGSFTDRLERLVGGLESIKADDRKDPVERIKGVVRSARVAQMEDLVQLVGQVRPIRVLIDGLDANWDANDSTSIYLLAGLVHITDEINSKLKGSLHVTLFMRSDIFDVIRRVDPDLDKRTRDVLSWKVEMLVRLLGLRIQHSLNSDLPPDACWREVFPLGIEGEAIEEYMISRTLMRPRDLINFATACVIEAQDRFHNKVTEDDVKQAEERYSESRLADLEQEHMATYPGLSKLFEAFLGAEFRMTEGKLVEVLGKQREALSKTGHCQDWIRSSSPNLLLRVLYDVGFVGIASGGQNTYSYLKPFERARAAAKQPRPFKERRRGKRGPRPQIVPTYVVHPAFRSYLEMN